MVAGSCAHTGTVLVQRFEQWRTLDAQRLEHVFCLTIQSTQPVGPRRDPALLQLPHVRDGGAHGICVWYFVPENAQLRDGRRTDERQHQEARKHNEPLHARRRGSSWRSSKKQHSVILSRSMHVFDEAPAPPPHYQIQCTYALRYGTPKAVPCSPCRLHGHLNSRLGIAKSHDIAF